MVAYRSRCISRRQALKALASLGVGAALVGCQSLARWGKALDPGSVDEWRAKGDATLTASLGRPLPGQAAGQDWRNIRFGYEIPKEHYCDQPYIVLTDDGAWLCTLTTGSGQEGQTGQHVISARSVDKGRTWSKPVDIEPPVPPESSWVMPLKVPGGRIYAIYLHNSDNLREVITDTGTTTRVDTLGYMVYKYSDDHGRSWSKERYRIPIRETEIDRQNPYGGKVRFLWGVGKPMIHDGKVYVGLAKVGRFGAGFLAQSEGWFLCSDNILSEPDPERIRWELLPDGEIGLRAPQGPIAEEHNLVALSDGSLYCTYRTVEGHNCHAYSRDGGHTWTPPAYATYTPGGRRIKHPRAANFVRKFSNGKFLLWFHNHGGKDYNDRNPAWLCGGVEKDGHIHWSEPEIVLYDDDPKVRISYPDFVEDAGEYYITETQKTIARVHPIDKTLLEGLWRQHENASVVREGLALELKAEPDGSLQGEYAFPSLPSLLQGGGLALELWVRFDSLDAGQVLLNALGNNARGVMLSTTADGTIQLRLDGGPMSRSWDCDPGLLSVNTWHHIVAIVDGGPKIITFVVDGKLCDGGDKRQFGWTRFSSALDQIDGLAPARIAPQLKGQIAVFRLYDRYLRTSEAVGNYRAGR